MLRLKLFHFRLFHFPQLHFPVFQFPLIIFFCCFIFHFLPSLFHFPFFYLLLLHFHCFTSYASISFKFSQKFPLQKIVSCSTNRFTNKSLKFPVHPSGKSPPVAKKKTKITKRKPSSRNTSLYIFRQFSFLFCFRMHKQIFLRFDFHFEDFRVFVFFL